MKKNKASKKRAARKRQKETTGQLEFTNVVYMDRELDKDGKVQVYAVCTCNKWRSSEEATTITKVGLEAKKHIEASDGKCAFRFHDVPEDMLEAQEKGDLVEKIKEELAEEASTEVDLEPTPKELPEENDGSESAAN